MPAHKSGPKPKEAKPKLLREAPSPPANLNPAAKKHWYKVVELMGAARVMSPEDCLALEQFCTIYARWSVAEAKVAAEGEVIKSPNGYMQPNPWLLISERAEKSMRAYFDRFGLTPEARSRLKIEHADENESKWGDLLSG